MVLIWQQGEMRDCSVVVDPHSVDVVDIEVRTGSRKGRGYLYSESVLGR